MTFYIAIIIGFFIGFSSAGIVLWWIGERGIEVKEER